MSIRSSAEGKSRSATHLCARLRDRTEVVNQVGLGHTETSVADSEDFVLFVRGDADVELLLGIESGGIGKGCIADLIESIGAVGDQFTQEDLLVRIERVWRERSAPDCTCHTARDLLMIKSNNWLISAWNPKLSASADILICAKDEDKMRCEFTGY